MGRRAITLALLLVVACSRGEQHAVPVALDPGQLAVIAVLDGDRLEAETLVDGRATRIGFPQGSTLFVWRFEADALVDRAGHPLDEATLAAATATTEPTEGCGRCTFEAVSSPQRIAPGDVCHVPPFVTAEAYENVGGPTVVNVPTLASEVAKRVFVTWPGACPCAPDEPIGELSGVEIAPEAPGPSIATRSGYLFDDGRIIGLTPGHAVTIDTAGEAREHVFPEVHGHIRSIAPEPDGLLVAMTDPKPSGDGTIYRVVTHEGVLGPRVGLPSLWVEAMYRSPDGALYVAGKTLDLDAATQVNRCTQSAPSSYVCTEETIVSGACDLRAFRFTSGVAPPSANPTTILVGNHGELLVRDASASTWSCHLGLAERQYFHEDVLYNHDYVDDYGLAPDGRLNLCSRGFNSTGASSVLWSIDLTGVETIEDLPETLVAATLSTTNERCHSLSVDVPTGRVRTIWGLGRTVVDVIGTQVTNRANGIGRPWDGSTPDLLAEVHGPVLDLLERGDFQLAVTADRSLFRRGPDGDAFVQVYGSRGGRVGPMAAMAPRQDGSIVTFTGGPAVYSREEGVVVRSRFTLDGFPPSANALADLAVADPVVPGRIVVTTHEAPRYRCTTRGTTKIPCPPLYPTRVDVFVVDIDEGRVLDRVEPPVDDPAIFVAGAALASGVFVFLDRFGRVFAMIDRAFVELEVEWDDPSTQVVEPRVVAPEWTDLAGRDGVAWLVGRDLVGRVVWRSDRTLAIEGFWHRRLGEAFGEVVPKTLDLSCADRGIVLGVTEVEGTTFTRAISPWVLGHEPVFCADAPFGLCPFPQPSAAEQRFHSFSKPLAWVTPLGALRFPGGAVAFLYDDATLEPRAGPRTITPFTYVGGYAVTDDLVLIGGEGQRVVSVTPP
ncbi:MAG: hypothetical protein RIT81_35260 [Deltaproteobacteria bacterium]